MLDKMLFKEYTNQEAKQFNPLQLALIGDAVYEVYVRSYVFNGNQGLSAHKIHVEAINYVKAKGQSDIMLIIQDDLTEDELYIFKRGRNAKSATVPKNANVRDYRAATGFESLIGYLYLTNQQERLIELVKKGVDNLKK
ncbi:Mini-ribonuclease 3 [uncultured Clostridium sp.]|uniref:Mini-ribonuclease 3 n=1 Tax=uncultured Clostridium sp. TaxID=59620 RepID=UPI00262F4595|nr:ribonuclease III domain-containing protein [uncultured Clostridium sp.]